MSSAPQHPGGTHRVDQPKTSRGPLNSVADFASRAARSAPQNAVNLGATRPGVTKMIAVAGASVLLIGGGIFAYNSMHQEENAFLASDDEYARVCQDATTGERVDDSECEKAGAQEPTANPSESAISDSSSSSSSHSGSSGSGSSGSSNSSTTTHHSGSNAFLWYYLGRQSAANSNGASASYIPRVGEKLSGGSTTRPSNGTVYSGVPSSGGGFEDSYRNAKKASTISSGKEISTKNTGKTSSVRDNTTGTVSNLRRNGTSGSNSGSSNSSKSGNKSGSKSGSSSSNKSGSKSSGSKGGFGGGSKSGGGHSGG
ncbi:MAG: hypothetical protein KH371_01300 [Rothia mucilaginosa]|uniref:hypothetical protein n=1 Tax=Rothia mucilaginosa TaxID=43675 RepID=UPI001E1946A9|nr:hypothetical protein [Rothia mucilaginosa]MBS6433265.1 hypothetical protein [Rothia mucilaginosa]